MSKRQKQQALLAALALILVIVVGRQVMQLGSRDSGSGVASGSAGTRRGDATPEDWRETLPRVEELRLSDLDQGSESLGEGRDPFQLSRPEPPPRPEPSIADLDRAAKKALRRQEKQVTVPIQPSRPTPPPVDVVYLGSFGSQRKRLAVFTDGNEIFNVPEGKVLKEKFVVVRIGFESADLGFVGFPDAPAQRLEIGG